MRKGLWRVGIFVSALLILSTVSKGEQPASGEKKARVEVRGLRIVGKRYGDDQSMRPFNWSSGTTIALLLTSDEGGIIGFDDDKSKVLKCQDDRGTDLLEKVKEGVFTKEVDFGGFPNISPDGRACLLELKLPRIPAPGATVMEVEGSLAVTFASEKKTYRQNVALKEGEMVSAGPIELKITKVGKPQFSMDDGDQLSLTLEAKQDLDSVAEIKFYDSEGKEIESSRQETSRWGMMGSVTVNWTYKLKRKVDHATVAVTRWTDMTEALIPFSVNVSLGL